MKRTSNAIRPGCTRLRRAVFRLIVLVFAFGAIPAAAQLKDATFDDYNQWKLALTAGGIASPVQIEAKPGFRVELVRTAAEGEGSWISLAFDPKGRAVLGREDKGLLRVTLKDGKVANVETIEDTLLEPRGLLFAHDSLYVHANNSKGLYRLHDRDGDDRYEEVTLLRRTEGGVGHGRNGLALGPDGRIYLALGNNVQVPKDVAATSPYRNYGLDRLLPCVWNEFLFDSDVVPPAGYIARTDPDGKTWELFAGGFRNPYDLAFNADGELFTYDADMEWDVGAPWYRPTTVMHVVSGGEYGWRQGTSVWPDHFPDALPRVADIGLGSPTGVTFGTGAKFPVEYQRALYVLDWAYGRIIAVHLTANGASYAGRAETLIKGRPLNVTDIAVGPDGAMYFTVGGRRTQSALYRVTWTGDPGEIPPRGPQNIPRVFRRNAAAFHDGHSPDTVKAVWPFLSDRDNWIRDAARVALESQPVDKWQGRALSNEPEDGERLESYTTGKLTALMALARCGAAETRSRILARLYELLEQPLSIEQRIIAWRTYQLAILRMGHLTDGDRAASLQRIERRFPAESWPENQLLCELLVALESPRAIAGTLSLFDQKPRQEEHLFYLYALRNFSKGWTLDQRRQYFAALKRAEDFEGAQYLVRYIPFIRTDALATLTDEERAALAPQISELGRPRVEPSSAHPPRPFVRSWTMDELLPRLESVAPGRDLARGKSLFTAARCADCHRLKGEGTSLGPNLAGASARFSRRDLLETILHPSLVVDEKYRPWILETDDGLVITGQFAGADAETLAMSVNPLEPTQLRRIRRSSIIGRTSSRVSPMPEGLLSTLTEEEILDLLSYLESASK